MLVYLEETAEWISHVIQNLIGNIIILNNTINDGLLYGETSIIIYSPGGARPNETALCSHVA